ncbi:uncharacterized protein LOC128155878 isoform X2 [Crassostrea angulata]|uniref:uncharacterized protein LOC128155878 isoform X2 n=1 Tax=Magallana angulata TaxID=2784310 RepID=UPI0022B185D4|nr:uncharacterized protein LOC128155878 isoform X2 [Crassostrea angulata]
MDKNIAGRHQLFAYTHFVLLAFAITWSKAKECGQSTSSKICCSGYREINGTCRECIGYYGKDCGDPCPTGLYGKRCAESCECSVNETCNQFVGCMPKPAFESKYRKSVHFESCFSLYLSVIALTASQIVTLICCLKTLRWKGCSLSAKQTERSTGLSTGMTLSQTNIGMSEARNESSRHLGISCEEEITNGLHCHTDRYQNILECPSDIHVYDTFETADRIKKA